MPITSLDGARDVAAQVADLSRRIREVPGLSEGHVERIYVSIQRLIQDYGQRPWWHHRFLLRELDAVAAEVKRLANEGGLAAEHLELFDFALYRLKKRRFRAAGKLLLRMKETVSMVQERGRLLEDYRLFYRQLERQCQALEDEILRLRQVPILDAGPPEVEATERLVATANGASAVALRNFLVRTPGREVVRLCLRLGSGPGLSFLAPSDREAAGQLLRLLDQEEGSGDLSREDLYGLIEAAGYTEARLAHLARDARRLRLLLQANVPWLRGLSKVPESSAVSVSIRETPEGLRQRIPSLRLCLSEVPGGEEASRHLQDLFALVETGRFASVQRSADIYRTHGEDAQKRWDGTLEPEISKKAAALEGFRRDLRGLPTPEMP